MAERTCRFCKKKFDSKSEEAIVLSKTTAFCSMQCMEDDEFDKLIRRKSTKKLSDEENKYRIKILEYIKDHSINYNAAAIASQIKCMTEDFEITYKQLFNVFMYAEKYENYSYDSAYGARQYDKYVLPTIRYMAELSRLKNVRFKPVRETAKPSTKGRIIKPFLRDEDETLEDD